MNPVKTLWNIFNYIVFSNYIENKINIWNSYKIFFQIDSLTHHPWSHYKTKGHFSKIFSKICSFPALGSAACERVRCTQGIKAALSPSENHSLYLSHYHQLQCLSSFLWDGSSPLLSSPPFAHRPMPEEKLLRHRMCVCPSSQKNESGFHI